MKLLDGLVCVKVFFSRNSQCVPAYVCEQNLKSTINRLSHQLTLKIIVTKILWIIELLKNSSKHTIRHHLENILIKYSDTCFQMKPLK